MADKMSAEDRSYTMSQIQSTGTTPEENLGYILNEFAGDEEVIEHADELPGTPDFWLPNLNLAFFADGCFFHKCPEHFQMPKSNQDYWKPKLQRNVDRDQEVNDALRGHGIVPVRIWEHDLKDDLTVAVDIVRGKIEERKGNRSEG